MILPILFSLSSFAAAPPVPFYAMEGGTVRLPQECFTESFKKKLSAKDADFITSTISHDKEKGLVAEQSKYLEFFDPKEIIDSCSLKDLRAYFDGKLHKLEMPFVLRWIVLAKNDCGFDVPYAELLIRDRHLSGNFLIGSDFTVLSSAETVKAKAEFQKAQVKDEDYGYPFAFLKGKDGATYIVANFAEMGTRYELFKLSKKKIENVASGSYPPCGS